MEVMEMELTEDEECYVCMICGSSPDLQSSVELFCETFQPTLTLERTLEMLCPKTDTKEMMEVLTREDGSILCCPCLAALHRGLGVVADILRLEEYVKNLGGSIQVAMRDSNDLRNKLEEKLGNTPRLVKEISPPEEEMIGQDGFSLDSKEEGELEDSDQDTQQSKTELEMESALPSTVADSRTNKKLRKGSKKKKKQKKTSVEAESSNRVKVELSKKFQPFPGVQNCPLCDYSVDVRTLEEAKAPESLPKFVCDTLKKNSTYRLVLHFKKFHLPANARTNFETDSEGKKQFMCVECPFKSIRFNKTVKHYLKVHVHPPAEDTSKRLPCPEGGCSFVADVSSQPGFRRASNIKRFFREAEAIAEHVIRDHDLAPLEEPCPGKFNYTTSFFVETDDNRKEYRCTRCYYYEGLAKGKDHSQSDISSCRRLLLQHFYEHHLTF